MSVVAVLGGGHGAHAVAAELSLAGFKVNLFELPAFKESFKHTLERKEVEILGEARQGVAKLNKATLNPKEALEDVEVVLLVAPAFGHKLFAETCAPYLRKEQMVILLPGTAGSLEFAKVLRDKGVKELPLLAETSTLPYGCRLIAPSKVMVYVVAKILPLGAFPSDRTGEALDALKQLYPAAVPAKNVIEAAINNPNPITHPAGVLLNVGRIEYAKGEFYLYKEGITPSVVRIYDALDEERLALCKPLGLKLFRYEGELPVRDREIRMGELFGPHSINAGIQMKGPSSTQDRFVTEDVPYGLAFMSSLGDMLNVPTPTMKSIVTLFSVINQVDYFKEGRTVEKLGIAGLSVSELNAYLSTGRLPAK